ncbi:MAG TPA: hypothetical protein VJ991_03940 [Balneolales bacterium]|nr:hypothetical protein [Balneolales bacterium]HYX06673.1 hypothetical protein [Bacteroidales bacterium]
MRDKFIHSGFDSFDGKYRKGIEQQRIMRAMSERLLLHRMGIDYHDTHLGMNDV